MKGIITGTVGGFFFVTDEMEKEYKTKIRGKIRKKVYPGDYVQFSRETNTIEKVLERKNLLKRPKIANVDQVLIVFSVQAPPFDQTQLDRFIILVEAAGIKPLIIINKNDLVENCEEIACEENLKDEFLIYTDLGYELCITSAIEKSGLSSLRCKLSSKINVMCGPSGAGKSSLINKIVKDADLETGSVSKKLKRGVHTTKQTRLLRLEDGGWIADTPGFSSLDLSHIKADELKFLFPEFDDYLNGCKFNTCSHTHEPGCLVKAAVENEKISSKRYLSYINFYKEIKEKQEM